MTVLEGFIIFLLISILGLIFTNFHSLDQLRVSRRDKTRVVIENDKLKKLVDVLQERADNNAEEADSYYKELKVFKDYFTQDVKKAVEYFTASKIKPRNITEANKIESIRVMLLEIISGDCEVYNTYFLRKKDMVKKADGIYSVLNSMIDFEE